MVNCDFLYDKEYFADKFKVKHFVEKDLSYTVYENAYIVPDLFYSFFSCAGVYTEQKEYVESTALHDGSGRALAEDKLKANGFCGETVVYIGIVYSVWGHMLTDVIKCFWFLKTEEYRHWFASCKLVYVKMGGELPQNVIHFFQLLGVELADLSEVKEITQYKRVVVPDPCFFNDRTGDRYFTKQYLELLQVIRTYQKERYGAERGYEKLYFTYSANGRRKGSVGEERLEKFFRQQGYQIIAPEKYTLEEQLKMLANCRYFASTDGSCAHNSVFLPEGANVILIPRAFYVTDYQRALNDAVDLNVFYIDASLSVLADRNIPWGGPFFYYESEQLRRFFQVTESCDAKYWKKQFKDFGLYLKQANIYRDLSERYMPEYYVRQFAYCMGQYQNSCLRNKLMYPFRKVIYKIRVCGIGYLMRIFILPKIKALFKE